MSKERKQDKIFSGITSIFLILLMTVFLFYCGNGGYQRIAEAKYNVFCMICGGYVVLMGILLAESIAVGAIKRTSIKELWNQTDRVQKLIFIYMILTWISAVFSERFPETVIGTTRYEGAVTITIYGCCFLLVSVFGSISKNMVYILGISISLFSVICLLQLSGSNPMGLYPEGLTYFDGYKKYAGAYLGTIGNVDLVAAYLSLAIPLLWIGILRLEGKQRFFLLIPLFLGLIVLVKMFVLAGLVGVFVGSLLAAPVIISDSSKKKKRFGSVVFLLMAGMGVFVYLVDLGSGMLHELHQILHGNLDGTFGSGRIHIWKSILEQVPSHLLLGAGPDTMAYAGFEPFTRFDDGMELLIVTHIDVAHNEYLNILFHQGLPALLVYLMFLGALAIKWIKYSEKDAAVAMLGGAALCYCVQAFFGFSMMVTAPFFWVILGLLDKRTKKEGE